jgi:hypothetical protein
VRAIAVRKEHTREPINQGSPAPHRTTLFPGFQR